MGNVGVLNFDDEVNKNSVFGYFFQPDPLLGWKMRPGVCGWYKKPEFHTHIKINNFGFRGQHLPIEKQDNHYRILVLSDSFGSGLEVNEDQLFSNQLEVQLNTRDPSVKYQVINLSTGGYGTEQEYLTLNLFGDHIKPDLILLGFHYGDDIIENSISLRKKVGWRLIKLPRPYFDIDVIGNLKLVNYPPPIKEVIHSWMYYYDLMGWGLRQHVNLPFKIKFDNRISWALRRMVEILTFQFKKRIRKSQIPIDLMTYNSQGTEEFNIAWSRTAALIGAIKDKAAEMNAAFIVFGVCTKEQLFPHLLYKRFDKYKPIKNTLDPNFPQKQLLKILNKSGISFIDLYPGFYDECNQQNNKLFYDHDIHWNERGHLKAADILANGIMSYLRAEH